METTVVLNNFPKTYIFITTSFIGIKTNFIGFVVAMVSEFKNLS